MYTAHYLHNMQCKYVSTMNSNHLTKLLAHALYIALVHAVCMCWSTSTVRLPPRWLRAGTSVDVSRSMQL